MRLTEGVLLAMMLAGCLAPRPALQMGPVERMITPQPDRCGLGTLPALQGRPMADLADFRLTGPLRVLWPGQEITNEVQPTRLNAQVDIAGRILRLFCG